MIIDLDLVLDWIMLVGALAAAGYGIAGWIWPRDMTYLRVVHRYLTFGALIVINAAQFAWNANHNRWLWAALMCLCIFNWQKYFKKWYRIAEKLRQSGYHKIGNNNA